MDYYGATFNLEAFDPNQLNYQVVVNGRTKVTNEAQEKVCNPINFSSGLEVSSASFSVLVRTTSRYIDQIAIKASVK